MQPTEYYMIGNDNKFPTLLQAKKYIRLSYSGVNKLSLHGKVIIGYNKPCETVCTITEIVIDEKQRIKFNKTKKTF